MAKAVHYNSKGFLKIGKEYVIRYTIIEKFECVDTYLIQRLAKYDPKTNQVSNLFQWELDQLYPIFSQILSRNKMKSLKYQVVDMTERVSSTGEKKMRMICLDKHPVYLRDSLDAFSYYHNTYDNFYMTQFERFNFFRNKDALLTLIIGPMFGRDREGDNLVSSFLLADTSERIKEEFKTRKLKPNTPIYITGFDPITIDTAKGEKKRKASHDALIQVLKKIGIA